MSTVHQPPQFNPKSPALSERVICATAHPAIKCTLCILVYTTLYMQCAISRIRSIASHCQIWRSQSGPNQNALLDKPITTPIHEPKDSARKVSRASSCVPHRLSLRSREDGHKTNANVCIYVYTTYYIYSTACHRRDQEPPNPAAAPAPANITAVRCAPS